MYKMINLFNWVTTLVESFTFYGGGGKGGGGAGGSASTSYSVDFFGEGRRKPYAKLLEDLLLGGPIGDTKGKFKGKGDDKIWIPGKPGVSLSDFIQSQPGYQFGYGQGLEALNRNFAATGAGRTGAQDIALQNFGNQYAGQYLQQLISNVMGPSGVNLPLGQVSTSTSTGANPLAAGIGGGIGDALSGLVGYGASSLFGGLPGGSLFSGTISDKNLKTNIKYIDTINGIKIYSFNYIWSYIKSIGVMAQDLLQDSKYKEAVHMTNIGYVVDYSKLPI